MSIHIESRHLNDIVVLKPDTLADERGFFLEAYRADEFRELGLPTDFLQDNHSRSKKGVIRGLHFQYDRPMGKLMRVTLGTAYLVAVDIRKGSPTVGRWVGLEVSDQNRLQVWAPAGFARGFYVLSDHAELQYKCTAIYNRKGETGIRWNDPQVGVEWPIASNEAVLSEKDRKAQSLAEWLASPQADLLQY